MGQMKAKKNWVSENLLDYVGDLPTSKTRIQKRINYWILLSGSLRCEFLLNLPAAQAWEASVLKLAAIQNSETT